MKNLGLLLSVFFLINARFAVALENELQITPNRETIRLNLAIHARVCKIQQNQLQDCSKKIILPEEEALIHLSFCSETEASQSCTGFWTNVFYMNGHKIETRFSLSEHRLVNWSYELSVKQQDPQQAQKTTRTTHIQLGNEPELLQSLTISGKPIAIDDNETIVIPELIISQSKSSFYIIED